MKLGKQSKKVSTMLEEKDGPEKNQLEQLGYDVFNVDDFQRNKVFRNELATLSCLKTIEV
jgi:hypothetical protein